VPAVEDRYRQEVDEPEVDRDDGHRPHEIRHPLAALLADDVVDRDRAAERGDADLALDDPEDADDDESHDVVRLLDRAREGKSKRPRVLDVRLGDDRGPVRGADEEPRTMLAILVDPVLAPEGDGAALALAGADPGDRVGAIGRREEA